MNNLYILLVEVMSTSAFKSDNKVLMDNLVVLSPNNKDNLGE